MKVLLAAFGSRGDVQPLFALALGLQARGHDVLLAASPDFTADAAALKLAFVPVGSSMRELFAASALSPTRAMLRLREEIAEHFAVLAGAARGCALVVGSSAALAAPSAAEAAGAAYRYLAFCPQALPSAHHPPPYLPWPSSGPLVSRVAWRMVRAAFAGVGQATISRHRANLGLSRLDDVLAHVLPRNGIVASDPALAPLPADLAVTAFCSGPLLLPDAEPMLEPRLRAFLEAGPPPVYVGFGSMTDARPQRTTAAVLQAVRSLGRRLVLSAGWAGLGGGMEDAEDVCVIPGAPHAALLPHVACAVHHGGAGTTAAAALAGVPQVIVPHMLDQPYWGMRIAKLELGPAPIPRARLSAKRLAAALTQALAPAALERAQAFAPRMTRDGVSRAVTFLEAITQP